jgi:hypoxanthine-guanine phosphoribosyltransferase
MNAYQQMVDNADQEIRVHGTQYLLETLNEEDGLLIVDDVFSSGLTTQAVIRRLSSRLKLNMPRDVKIATPWYKPSHNRTDKAPDFYLHSTENWLVMPYELSGLTGDEIAQHKSYMMPILENIDPDKPGS